VSAFKETNAPDAKYSMTRTIMFMFAAFALAFVVLAYIAVLKAREPGTVSAIIVGGVGASFSGVGAAFAKAWEVKSQTKESAAQ